MARSLRNLYQTLFKRTDDSLKLNTISNFAGSVWTALISLLFVPVYLRYLGIEAYGIIGVFLSLQTILWIVDLGVSPAINRELARLAPLPEKAQEMRDLTRSLSIVNWSISLAIAAFLLALSPLIAHYWIQSENLPAATISQSLMILSVATAFQFPGNFYTSGLMGLQKQPLLNLINIFFATLRSVGALLVLIFVSQTIQAFLIWQAATAALQTLTMAVLLHRSLPPAPAPAEFRMSLLRQIWRFAAGVSAIGIVALILTQTDKIILSRMLTLEYFGYYTLATTIAAMALGVIMSSVNNAVYPRFSRLVALDDEAGLRLLYHQSCQLMAVLILPTTAMLAFFSPEILRLWTRSEVIAANTYLLLTLVAVGTGIKGLLWLPFHLQLAYGWTKLSFYTNLAAVFILAPLMVVGVLYYGAAGGGAAWVILNSAHFVITIQIMHRRLLKNDLLKWYWQDVGLPLAAVLAVSAASRWLIAVVASPVQMFLWLGTTFFLSIAAAALLAPETRKQIFLYARRFFSGKADEPLIGEKVL